MREEIIKILPLLVLIIIVSCTVQASHYDNTCISAKAIGLGYCFTSLVDDPTAIYWNPANLGKGTGVYFTRTNPYGISDYIIENIVISKKVKSLFHLGVAYNIESANLISWDSETKYKEKRLGIGIAVPVNKRLNLGLTSWKSTLRNGDEFNNDNNFDVAVGFRLEPVSLVLAFRNLASSVVEPSSTLGIGFDGQRIRVGFDLNIGKGFEELENSYLMGIETKIHENVILRFGVSSSVIPNAIGIGLKKNNLNFDFSYSNNLENASYYCYSMGVNF